MHARRCVIRLGIALFFLVHAGCSKEVKPGVTYNVSIITKGNDGKAAAQEPVTRVKSAVVETVQEIPFEGQTLSLLVRKTQYGKATFDIAFPDKTIQRVRVNAGETKDILPRGQKIGVRLEVQECH